MKLNKDHETVLRALIISLKEDNKKYAVVGQHFYAQLLIENILKNGEI